MSLVADLKMGLTSEERVKARLEGAFDELLTKTDQFHAMDYEGTKCWVEIKTRRNTYSAYPDTMLPYSKVEFANKTKRPVYFVFVFTDGVYYITYNKQLFSKYRTSLFCRAERVDNIDVEQDYIFIPIDQLTRI